MDNVKHKPGGGEKKIFDDKEYIKQMSSTTSKAGSEGIASGTQVGIFPIKTKQNLKKQQLR